MGNGECCSDFGERVCQFIFGKSNMIGDPLEALSYTGGEGVWKIPKDFCWRNAGAVERRVRAWNPT